MQNDNNLRNLIHQGANSGSINQYIRMFKSQQGFYNTPKAASKSVERTFDMTRTPSHLSSKQKAAHMRNLSQQNGDDEEEQRGRYSHILGDALNRRTISNQYHNTAYPSFMRANGPFKIYDHHKEHGPRCHSNIQKTNLQAEKRFQGELNTIRDMKESQKKVFAANQLKCDIINRHKANLKFSSNLNNFQCLQNQIEDKSVKLKEHNRVENLYYKPHFGPEETDNYLKFEDARAATIKNSINTSLTGQINYKSDRRSYNNHHERTGDLKNLAMAQTMYVAEETALRNKGINEKQELKNYWIQQMQDRKRRNQMERIFN